jgi:hypothetical protein
MRRLLFVIFLLVLLVGTGAYFYMKGRTVLYQAGESNTTDTAGTAGDTALLQETISALGKFVVLPEGDQPVLGVVSDPSALSGEIFFKDAQIGDRVLIYPHARQAILYRPSLGKIINMESIPMDSTTTSTVGVK